METAPNQNSILAVNYKNMREFMRDLVENGNVPFEPDTISDQENYVLKLYVNGQTRNSRNELST
jgi:hypothetical protein